MNSAFGIVTNIFLNYWKTVEIKAVEDSKLLVGLDLMYAVNMESVSISTYSLSNTLPRKATLIFTDKELEAPTSLTITSIGNFTRPVDQPLRYIGLSVINSSFTINNLDIQTDLVDQDGSFLLLETESIRSHHVLISDLSIKISGSILSTEDPMNLWVSNVEIDYSDMSFGFNILSAWDDIGSNLQNEIVFENVSVFYSQQQNRAISKSFISVAGPANLTIVDSSIQIGSSTSTPFPPVQFNTITSWNPNDSLTQILLISNTTFGFEQDSEMSRFTQVTVNIGSTYYREVVINIHDNFYQSLDFNQRSILEIYGNSRVSASVTNLSLKNHTFEDSVMKFFRLGKLSMKNLEFTDIEQFGTSLISLSDVVNVDISEVSITLWDTNCEQTETKYLIHDTSSSGYLKISDLTISNVNLQDGYVIYTTAVPSFSLTNAKFESITLHEAQSVVKTGTLQELSLINITFDKIHSVAKTKRRIISLSLEVWMWVTQLSLR